MAFGIDMGPSSGETGATNSLNGEAGFAGSVGKGLLSDSSALISALLSGDPGKIAKFLAPQISEISKRANEKTQTNAQFAGRSGGVNASNQNTMDQARAGVNDLISGLTSSAIGEGASLGSNLLGQSMGGLNDVFGMENTMQNQRAAKWDDIMKSVMSVAGGVAGGAGKLFGLGKGLDPGTFSGLMQSGAVPALQLDTSGMAPTEIPM